MSARSERRGSEAVTIHLSAGFRGIASRLVTDLVTAPSTEL